MLIALYYNFLKLEPFEDRDRFLLSKAHASSALYFILADLGFFDKKQIANFASYATYGIPGIEFTGGSLGMGLGVACGMAYGLKMKKKLPLVICMVGDGELYEGSNWEAFQFASAYRLNNLVCIIDRNFMSANDFTENFSPLEPLEPKLNAFGWDVLRINGDDTSTLLKIMETRRLQIGSRPLCIIANTIKGCGHVEFEGKPMCHTMKI
uniref:Putative transketolase domain containing protein n=1 Tax=viral metagenome TaxID=1070528 RepID=A0A6M3INB5_9ZZZZ